MRTKKEIEEEARRENRREAQHYGSLCVSNLAQAESAQEQVTQWRERETKLGVGEEAEHARAHCLREMVRWQQRADSHRERAIEAATKAAHWARLAL